MTAGTESSSPCDRQRYAASGAGEGEIQKDAHIGLLIRFHGYETTGRPVFRESLRLGLTLERGIFLKRPHRADA